MRSTLCAVRLRDGRMVLRDALSLECTQLRRAGFRPHCLRLTGEDGTIKEAELWMQDAPALADLLNAAHLLFQDEPGSLTWT